MFYQNSNFLTKFIKLMKECNKLILDVYKTDFDILNKIDKSPLTIADKRCNDYICNYLNKLNLDNCIIISEEIKNESYKKRKQYDWCWLVDPLDGTKEFIKKNDQFTINIGLCYQGIPVFGIVSIPVTGQILYGINGIGSYSLDISNTKKKLDINKKDLSQDNLRIVASGSHLNDETKIYISKFKNPEIVNIGSSIKLLWIAENKADIYPRIAPTYEWDTCAAHAIVKYAGGNVLDFHSNKELNYNKENLLNPYFIVY